MVYLGFLIWASIGALYAVAFAGLVALWWTVRKRLDRDALLVALLRGLVVACAIAPAASVALYVPTHLALGTGEHTGPLEWTKPPLAGGLALAYGISWAAVLMGTLLFHVMRGRRA